MKKQLVLMLTIVCSLTLVLAGCSSTKKENTASPAASTAVSSTENPATAAPAATANPADEITGNITFVSNRTDMDDQFKAISAKFHEKYPNATVEIEPIKDMVAALKVRFAANEGPDVSYSIATTTAQYPDFYAPLDDMGFQGKTVTPLIETGGHVYGVNQGNNVTGILYNKKTFAAAGITAIPKTLDEFFAVLDTLKAKGIQPLGSMVKSVWPLVNWDVLTYGNLADPYKLNELMLATDTPYSADSAFVKQYNFLRTLVGKGYFEKDMLSSDWDVLRKEMPNGKIGMLMLANYGIGALEGTPIDDIGFFALPIDNSGTPVALVSPDNNMVINKNTKHLATAKAFIQFWLYESGFNDHVGSLPNIVGQKPGNKVLAEFMESNPRLITSVAPADAADKYAAINDQANAVLAKAQITSFGISQEIVLNKDDNIQPILDKYNKKWAAAKKFVADK